MKKWKIFEKMEMLKADSWFNKLLLKYFNRRLIYQRSIFYDQTRKVLHTCNLCKNSLYELPNFKQEKYVYKLEDPFHVSLQDVEPEHKDIDIYGWVIEYRYQDYHVTTWYQHWNHKVYKTKKDALDSIIQLKSDFKCWRAKSSPKWGELEVRVIPLYQIKKNLTRDITLNKLLN